MFNMGRFDVAVPHAEVHEWATSDTVDIESDVPGCGGELLHLLIEKDSECLHGSPVNQGDYFPNPVVNRRENPCRAGPQSGFRGESNVGPDAKRLVAPCTALRYCPALINRAVVRCMKSGVAAGIPVSLPAWEQPRDGYESLASDGDAEPRGTHGGVASTR